jgi:hypothetical protein
VPSDGDSLAPGNSLQELRQMGLGLVSPDGLTHDPSPSLGLDQSQTSLNYQEKLGNLKIEFVQDNPLYLGELAEA